MFYLQLWREDLCSFSSKPEFLDGYDEYPSLTGKKKKSKEKQAVISYRKNKKNKKNLTWYWQEKKAY